MNPIRIALALLVLATVSNAALLTGTGTGSGRNLRSGTGTGSGLNLRSGTGTGVGSIVGLRPFPENGLLKGVDRTLNALHPSGWMNKVMQNVPSLDSISYENLIRMPVSAASTLLKTIFMHSYLRPFTGSLFNPNYDEIQMHLITATGNVSVPLSQPLNLNNYPQLATGEVTIFITGFPSNSEDPSDAVTQLVEAYRLRYNLRDNTIKYINSWDSVTSGSLIVIDLGKYLNTLRKWVTLDIEKVGETVGQSIVELSTFVPYYNIHLIGHSVGAHVAGVAARHFSQVKDKELRRVTGLDPSKIFTRAQKMKSQLNRGVAKFVDVIHTTSFGLGTESNGDVDFYPDGPGSVASSSDIIQSSLRSIEYYAETVVPENARNFMAVECSSLEDYENRQCYGMRIPMGYNTPMDVKGSFVLKVNSNAPYGKNGRILTNNRNRSTSY